MRFAQTFFLVTCLFALAAGFPYSSQELQPGIPTFSFEAALKRQPIQIEQSLIPLTRQKRNERVYFENEYQPSYSGGCRGSGCSNGGYVQSPVIVPIREYRSCRGSGCSGGGYRESTPILIPSSSSCRGSGCSNGGYRETITTTPIREYTCRGSGCNNGGYRESTPILVPSSGGCRGSGCGNVGYRETITTVPIREYSGCRGSGCNNGGYREYTTCRNCGKK